MRLLKQNILKNSSSLLPFCLQRATCQNREGGRSWWAPWGGGGGVVVQDPESQIHTFFLLPRLELNQVKGMNSCGAGW